MRISWTSSTLLLGKVSPSLRRSDHSLQVLINLYFSLGLFWTIALVPTTAGTGSETTGTAILDITSRSFKTGIANRAMKPLLGVVDPLNTESCPTAVHISAGLDVLFHSMESYTAIPCAVLYILRPDGSGWLFRFLDILNARLARLTLFFDPPIREVTPWQIYSQHGRFGPRWNTCLALRKIVTTLRQGGRCCAFPQNF